MKDLPFNNQLSTIMHIDLNSCFATIEQQANPYLRGKPVAVVAYDSPGGCIISPSIEAKKKGIKVGMRVKEGRLLCPNLIIRESDPWKYRNVHLSLRKIISNYTADYSPKSIDEFVLDLGNYPCLKESNMQEVAKEIKKKIKEEIGGWLTVSIGIAPNKFLAKTASSLHKPNGLDEINKDNFLDLYTKLKLTDLCGIKSKNATRLNSMGIFNVLDFYNAPIWKLKAAFNSINGYYWYLRLRGWEVDDFVSNRKSYGNSFVLPKPLIEIEDLSPIISKLVEKTSYRVREADYKVGGVHLGIIFRDWSFWHKGVKTDRLLFDSKDIYREIFKLLLSCSFRKPVRELNISVFNLSKNSNLQLELFDDICKKEKLVKSIDKVNNLWGNFTLIPARMLYTQNLVIDRIAFGGVKPACADRELEKFTLNS